MSVPFNDPNDPYYSLYSIITKHLYIPDYWDIFEPTSQDDFNCLSVITPSIERGATRWTSNGRWITIGVYRDEGRDSAFYETNVVFRLLPSFNLITHAQLVDFFNTSLPAAPIPRELFNITTSETVKLPSGKNKNTNYNLPTSGVTDKVGLNIRFLQKYDETGAPLKIVYNDFGLPVAPNQISSIKQNAKILYQVPQVNETSPGDDNSADITPDVYDFYGLKINDPTRGPWFSSTNVYRDLTATPPLDNIARANNGVADHYTGKLYDRFGNIVIGIQTNNALVSRVPILPLRLDSFNYPTGVHR